MMLSFVFSVVTTLAAVAHGQLTINTPASLVQCQPVQLSWANGKAPYYPSTIPAGQASAAPLAKFPPQEGTAFTWVVNLRSGTDVTIRITDATGATAYSSPVMVQDGFDDKCLSEAVNVTSGSAGGQTTGGQNGQNQTNAPPSSNGGNANGSQTQQQPQNAQPEQNQTEATPIPAEGNATQSPAENQPQTSPAAANSTASALSASALSASAAGAGAVVAALIAVAM